MFRKTILAAAATAALAGAAFTPTAAAAYDSWRYRDSWRHHDSWRYHHRPSVSLRFHSPYAYAPRCYTTKRWVHTHWGWRRHTVRVCR